MKLQLDISPELHALIKGFAGYHRQKVPDYILDAVLSEVQADSDASHGRDTPEAAARACRAVARRA